MDFLVSNTNYSLYIAAARKKLLAASATRREKKNAFHGTDSRGGFTGSSSHHLDEVHQPFATSEDDFLPDEDYDTSYGSLELPIYSHETTRKDSHTWESVSEWSSTVFIVHAIIVSEADNNWTSSAYSE